ALFLTWNPLPRWALSFGFVGSAKMSLAVCGHAPIVVTVPWPLTLQDPWVSTVLVPCRFSIRSESTRLAATSHRTPAPLGGAGGGGTSNTLRATVLYTNTPVEAMPRMRTPPVPDGGVLLDDPFATMNEFSTR